MTQPAPTGTSVLDVTGLSVTFPTEAGPVHAVRGLSFSLRAGSVLGIVGESGSGKSATAMAIMGLLPPSARVAGSVRLGGRGLLDLTDKELSELRGSSIAMVFQDPLSALTPVYTVGNQIAEAILVHQDVGRAGAARRAVELLDLVGIPDPAGRARAFPHEFSGGMRQRVMIAMAVANNPDVILADEPTTALDVTIQAQVLEVLRTAQRETGAAIVLITHDLGVVAGFADEVIVMYAGRAVEQGPVDEVFAAPRMPYTLGLLGSIPRVDSHQRARLTPIEGAPPSMLDLPSGCPFQPRCPMRIDICTQVEPDLATASSAADSWAGDSRAGGPSAGGPSRAGPSPEGGRPSLNGVTDGHPAACHRQSEVIEGALAPTDVFQAPPPVQRGAATLGGGARPVVLSVAGLVRHFPLLKGSIFRRQVGVVRAVDGVDLEVRERETVGLVGESGCGKTTTINEILTLAAPQGGRVVVLGKDASHLARGERRRLRRDVSVVFQDPTAALDPRMPLGDILAEGLLTYGVDKGARRERVGELLRLVGLEPSFAGRYPNEFSGGQRQRIGIARALALEPKLIVLDEPVSALDVSIQAGVINLLEDLQERLGLSYLFVSHDLSVVRHVADRVAVMYLGRIVEAGGVEAVFTTPIHPYTQALLSAVPLPDPPRERTRRRIILEGDLPDPASALVGCRFRSRCFRYEALTDPVKRRRCETDDPEPTTREDGHEAACHHPEVLSVL